MKRVRVALSERSYDVLIGEGGLSSRAFRECARSASRIALVSSAPVLKRHGARLRDALQATGATAAIPCVLPDGEAAKTVRSWDRLLRSFAEAGLDRSSLVLAFGGGTVGDAAGFAAASYMRGLRWVQVPTTLLAMVDSSVGGKTGLNLKAGKNLAGAFHQPSLVVADPSFLATLPAREFRSGAFEVLKCAFLRGGSLLALMERTRGLRGASPRDLEAAIAAAVSVKARIVERDERESGDRALLNLGHTLAHAMEAALRYRGMTHGEAVGHGLEFVVDLSEGMDLASAASAGRMRKAIALTGVRPGFPARLADRAADLVLGDKKRAGAQIREVLLARPGRPVIRAMNADALARLMRAWLAARAARLSARSAPEGPSRA